HRPERDLPASSAAPGTLRRVLPNWQAGPFPVYAVTDTRLLPAKTRIFIEFLAERLRGDWHTGNTIRM
ncbi:MAG: hypothetical protein EOO27_17410, partial [Comamonadaceae bacterium]